MVEKKLEQRTGKSIVKIKIKRGRPKETEENRFDVYQVPLEEKMSVFNALEYIHSYIDPSLAFYTSCRIGKCMGCTMMINGKRRLACTTLVEGDLILEPDTRFAVIRDLVVDMSQENDSTVKRV